MESSITLKVIIGFITLLIVVRLLGKKELSQLTPIDLVYLLVLGGLLEESIYDEMVPFWEVMYTAFLWAILVFIFDFFIRKFDKLRPMLKGKPSIIIKDGELDIQALQNNKLEAEQLRTMLRQQGIFTLKDVKYAILEPGGQVSVMEYKQSFSINTKMTHMKADDDAFSYLVVDEGKVEAETLSNLNKKEEWLFSSLQEEGYENIKQIFYAEWSKENGFIVKEYE